MHSISTLNLFFFFISIVKSTYGEGISACDKIKKKKIAQSSQSSDLPKYKEKVAEKEEYTVFRHNIAY